jgi:hypothetical protein
VEDVLLFVYQKTQGLRKELTEKTNEIQVGLQATEASIDTWTRSLEGDIMDIKKDFQRPWRIQGTASTKIWMPCFGLRQRQAEIKISQERIEAKVQAT